MARRRDIRDPLVNEDSTWNFTGVFIEYAKSPRIWGHLWRGRSRPPRRHSCRRLCLVCRARSGSFPDWPFPKPIDSLLREYYLEAPMANYTESDFDTVNQRNTQGPG